MAGTGVKEDASLKALGCSGLGSREVRQVAGSVAMGLDGDSSGNALPAENAWISDRAERSGRVPRASREEKIGGELY